MINTLRPLTLGELLDRTFSYYRRHFTLFVGIAALPNLFTLVVQLSRLAGRGGRPSAVSQILWPLLQVVVALIVGALTQGGTVVAVSQLQLGRSASVSEAFARIRTQLGEIIVVMLNVGVRVMLGLLLLIVPGVLLALKYALAVPAAILEQNGIQASLERSGDLTEGRRFRIFVVYALFFVLTLAATLFWQVPTMLVAVALGGRPIPGAMPTAALMVSAFGAFAVQALVAPILTIAVTLVYYDERVRREAFDLEHMMQQLDGVSGESLQTA